MPATPGRPPGAEGSAGSCVTSLLTRVRAVSGMLSYCDRYGEGMTRVLKTFGPIPEFSGATARKVHQVRGLTGEQCRPSGRPV